MFEYHHTWGVMAHECKWPSNLSFTQPGKKMCLWKTTRNTSISVPKESVVCWLPNINCYLFFFIIYLQYCTYLHIIAFQIRKLQWPYYYFCHFNIFWPQFHPHIEVVFSCHKDCKHLNTRPEVQKLVSLLFQIHIAKKKRESQNDGKWKLWKLKVLHTHAQRKYTGFIFHYV